VVKLEIVAIYCPRRCRVHSSWHVYVESTKTCDMYSQL